MSEKKSLEAHLDELLSLGRKLGQTMHHLAVAELREKIDEKKREILDEFGGK